MYTIHDRGFQCPRASCVLEPLPVNLGATQKGSTFTINSQLSDQPLYPSDLDFEGEVRLEGASEQGFAQSWIAADIPIGEDSSDKIVGAAVWRLGSHVSDRVGEMN